MSNVIPMQHPSRSRTSTRGTDDRAVYTVAEVARLLSLSLGGTYELVRQGEIPAKKMGARWIIPKQRFHTWLDGLVEEATEDPY